MAAERHHASRRQDNLGYFFDEALHRAPEKVAIIDLFGGSERTRTYRELDRRMDQVARMLVRLGVRGGERVGMLVGNRLEFVEFFFGAMRAGAIPVALNTRLAADTLSYIVKDAACVAVLVDPGSSPHAIAVTEEAHIPEKIILDEERSGFRAYETELALPSPEVAPPLLSKNAQAFQPYTSGSTGRPKGAIMTHHGMLWYVRYNQRHWPASPDDRGLVALPLFHKNALRGTVKPMLYAGGSFVIMPAYEPTAYLETLAKYRCTFSRGVAAVFTMFLQRKDLLQRLDLGALKSMSIGSAVVAPELLEAVERALPGVKISESYGLTEGGSPFRAPVDGRPVPRGSVGVQAPEVEVKLVDPAGNEQGTEGELCIRSPYVCMGYHNQPEITRQKLQGGWLRTGDIFHKDPDGFYFFRSRVDDMFSCGGENIYPKEVENLLFTHSDVANAVVTAVPHSAKGFVPAAMVVPRDGASIDPAEIKSYCLAKGPAYAHPRHVEVVTELPLNGAGKIDRAAVGAKLKAAHAAQQGSDGA